MVSRRGVVAGALASPLVLSSIAAAAEPVAAPAAPVPPTLEELLRPGAALDTALSPDGTRLAILREQREGDKRTALVILGDVENIRSQSATVVLGDYDVDQIEWANDDRLLIWLSFSKAVNGKPTGIWFYDEFVEIPVKRLMAVGVDGKDPVVLFNNNAGALKRDYNLSNVVDLLPREPRKIMMQMWDYHADCWALHKVDVYTGEAVEVERGGLKTEFWFLQDGVPVLRYDRSSRATVTVLARAPGETSWKLVRKFRRNELSKIEEFDVVAATPEPGVLLVSHRAEKEDFKVIRRFDLKTLTMGDVVIGKAGHDLETVFMDERMGLIAASYTDDRHVYETVDPNLAGHLKGLNTYFKNEKNVFLYDANVTHTRFLLHVRGPQDPGAFYLYNRDARSIDLIATEQPWLTAARLAPMETLHIPSRDGVTLTAYLTRPIKPGPAPMVVLPHGGPESRDNYDFHTFAQALAAQGWYVLQPNFRGSGGYGKAFADAGRRHWGDRMQEDVEDCVAHMVKSGRIDPARLAICGGSYGGYAALMGAVRNPTLYRGAVSIAGVSNLLEILKDERLEGADSPSYLYWVKTIGDPKTDRALLERASPALRAAEIAVPVLLLHGSEDDVVSPDQSKIMDAALRKAGKVHAYEVIKGMDHTGWSRAEWKKVIERTTTFLTPLLKA